MASEVATAPLNYADVKKKAIASKQVKTITAPSNGAVFQCGQTFNIETVSNSPGLYLDTAMSYLKFKITSTNASTINLDQSAYALINRMLITSAGQVFQDTQNYNLLHNALMSMSAGQDYINGTGRILMGAHGNNTDNLTYEGATIGAGGSLVVSLPLALSPLVNSTPYRYIYVGGGRAPFQFKLTLEQASVAFVTTGQALENSQITISDIEFHCFHVQLNEQAQAQVSAMTGGRYNILATEFVNFQTTLANGVNALSFPLGLARSSVDRVLVIHRPQATTTSGTAYSLSNRAKADMEHIRLMVSGQSIPQRRIEVGAQGGASNAIAEYLIANHNLDDMNQVSSLFYSGAVADNFNLANGAGNASNTVGSFIVAINTDSLPHNSDKAFSGVNTIGQQVFLEVGYSTVPAAMVVDVFAQSTILMTMDESAGAVYQVSV